ncbi:MAG TPA: hypothetical protein VK795_08750 [Terriglobales bacterium]|nr:hypothetical protein [Terriglobales bacterium]
MVRVVTVGAGQPWRMALHPTSPGQDNRRLIFAARVFGAAAVAGK